MRDKVVTCDSCGEPFLVGADDRRHDAEYVLCDDCGEHLALEFCREYKE